MKIKVITSYKPGTWDEYAKRAVDSVLEHWPANTDVAVYHESQKQDIINIFKISKLLSEAKSIFITKYDKAVATKHFIDKGDGTLGVTKAEGFVAVDHTENGIKLVDRLEFSRNNFNAGKPGAKK